MVTTRREFIRCSAMAGTLAGLGTKWALSKNKTLLILGGTSFLGPELVAAAKARGYTVTLFNRGKTNPKAFPDLEQIHGDRNVDADIDRLKGRSWDAVIDTSAYWPKQVDAMTARLADGVKQYVLISTISVFSDNSKPGINESSPVGTIAPEVVAKVSSMKDVRENYGPLKALCEQAAEKGMPGRATVIRPGLIVGPGDPSDRFTYWPVRLDRGGEVLAPGTPDDPVQVIDVRDLAEWTIHTVDTATFGLFNATGPKQPLPMGTMLEACRKAAGKDATFTWVDAKFLEEQKVEAWSDMPAWVPPVGEMAGFARVDCSKAMAKGLSFRPIEVTAKDTLSWWKTLPDERRAKPRPGLAPERETAVLAAWHARGKKP